MEPLDLSLLQPYLTPDITSKPREDKQDLLAKAARLAEIFKGECLSTASSFSICKGKNTLKFKCQNNHTFFLGANFLDTFSLEDLHTDDIASVWHDIWCYKCWRYYEQCREVARQVGVVVVSKPFGNSIELRCEKRGHKFAISYSKKLRTLTCSDCKKQEKDELKEQLRREEERRNEELEKKQKELFEKARQAAMEENQRQSSSSSSSSNSSNSNNGGSNSRHVTYSYYQTMEEKINERAKTMTIEYIRDHQHQIS